METAYLPGFEALEVRTGAQGVHELEGLCVPYDTPTTRAPGTRDEVWRFGALAGAAMVPGKIRLLDENHLDGMRMPRRPVGVGVRLTELAEGLHGRFRFYDTPEGRSAYENVREGTYGGLSVGFVAVREGAPTAPLREVLEARLHHVSLVDEPAYVGAAILALRGADGAAPDAQRWAYLRTPPRDITDITAGIDTDSDDLFTVQVARARRRAALASR